MMENIEPRPISQGFYDIIKKLPSHREYTIQVAGVTIRVIGTNLLPKDKWTPVYIMPEMEEISWPDLIHKTGIRKSLFPEITNNRRGKHGQI